MLQAKAKFDGAVKKRVNASSLKLRRTGQGAPCLFFPLKQCFYDFKQKIDLSMPRLRLRIVS